MQYRDKGTQDRFGKGQGAGTANREAFRGRAEQGRRDIAKQGTGAVSRDVAKGQRPSTGSTRPGGTSKGGSLDRGRSPQGFDGVGHGNQVRRESTRGHASRQSAGMSGSRGGGGGGRSGGRRR